MISAVIFDMDGVIIDSEYYYKKRMFEFIKQYNPDIQYFEVLKTAGFGKKDNTAFISRQIGKSFDEAFSLYSEYKSSHYIGDYNSIKNEDCLYLIDYLKANNYKLGLATSGLKDMIDMKINGIGLENTFDCIITGSDIKEFKPNPEIYLKVINILNVEPSECLVVEDSTVGIEASKAAKITTVARLNRNIVVDTSKADYQVYDLKEVIPLLEKVLNNEKNKCNKYLNE